MESPYTEPRIESTLRELEIFKDSRLWRDMVSQIQDDIMRGLIANSVEGIDQRIADGIRGGLKRMNIFAGYADLMIDLKKGQLLLTKEEAELNQETEEDKDA